MVKEELIHYMNCGLTGNELKAYIQKSIINKWLKNNGVGYVEAYTGFGKGYMLKTLLQRYKVKYTDNVIIIVPSTKLKDDFTEVVKQLNIENVHIYVINTFVLSDNPSIIRKAKLVIVDELHNICNTEAEYFSTVLDLIETEWFLGVSATLDIEHKKFLKSKDINCIENISIFEARKLDLLPEYNILNVGVELTEEEKEEYTKLDTVFKSSFNFFTAVPQVDSFALAMGCSFGDNTPVNIRVEGQQKQTTTGKLRRYVAGTLGVDESLVKVKAMNFRTKMRARDGIIMHSRNKNEALKELLDAVGNEYKTIVFCTGIDQANYLQKISGNTALAYHSKITPSKRKKIFDSFKLGVFTTIFTISALNEGADMPKLDLGINVRYDGKERKAIQQLGRLLRVDQHNPNKIAYMIYLYCKPFISYSDVDDDLKHIIPTDLKRLKRIQESMVHTEYINLETCLKILKKK
jgi:superfamily II DNA or RNA helicase